MTQRTELSLVIITALSVVTLSGLVWLQYNARFTDAPAVVGAAGVLGGTPRTANFAQGTAGTPDVTVVAPGSSGLTEALGQRTWSAEALGDNILYP